MRWPVRVRAGGCLARVHARLASSSRAALPAIGSAAQAAFSALGPRDVLTVMVPDWVSLAVFERRLEKLEAGWKEAQVWKRPHTFPRILGLAWTNPS